MARAKTDANNVIAEWFGYRVYPKVASTAQALADQHASRCPFLSATTETAHTCIKPAKTSIGVCTISLTSNGPRQDWPACPYRAMDRALLENAARRMFGIEPSGAVSIHAANTLERENIREEISWL